LHAAVSRFISVPFENQWSQRQWNVQNLPQHLFEGGVNAGLGRRHYPYLRSFVQREVEYARYEDVTGLVRIASLSQAFGQ
jgi:hypothetical protein